MRWAAAALVIAIGCASSATPESAGVIAVAPAPLATDATPSDGAVADGALPALLVDDPGLEHEVAELIGDQRQDLAGEVRQRRLDLRPIGARVQLAEADHPLSLIHI